MRYLCSVISHEEANAIAMQLEANGIPVLFSNVYSHGLLRMTSAPIDVWIGLSRQYTDAVEIFRNPDHIVIDPVDAELFHCELEDLRDEMTVSNETYLNFLFCTGLTAFLMWVIYAFFTLS